MRHLRPFTAFFAIATIAAACASSSPGASTGGNQSQGPGASTGGGGGGGGGGGASQPAASTGGGGGGGGGGGINGSVHYEITGDVTKSGDLDFFVNAGVSQFTDGGWVAYFYNADSSVVLQVSSSPSALSAGYGDGEITVVAGESDGCTFNWSKNDASGLKGTIDCPDPTAVNASGAQVHVHFKATVDAHT